jgi:nicotinate phosphoribosyltransferase
MNKAEQQTVQGILFTDQYQLSMAQLYFRTGLHEREVQFDHFFRSYPDYGMHKAGYCIAAGMGSLLDWMKEARFRPQDLEHLRQQKGRTGRQVFDEDFLAWLGEHGHFESLTIQAIPEGRVVHPNEPLTVVRGPLAMAQILETSLLNHLNYQTLIATKAARIKDTGRGQLMIDFGLRRAQGFGGNAGTRAALIGGADFSSNVGVSAVMGLPARGTHAHSMVQLFMTLGMGELEAFRAYAEVYPDDCLLLVDTINTLESGVPNAIRVFEELRQKGHQPLGIRLDSGDLAYLSLHAAKMLNEAGFPDTSIVLSNNLDEMVIWQILTQISDEAPRNGLDAGDLIRRLVYGVGTRLITSWGEPALGGVYKLVAVQDSGAWLPAIKVSESPQKTPNPGSKRVWRLYDQRGKATADLLSLQEENPTAAEQVTLRHPIDATKSRQLPQNRISEAEELLVEVYRQGRREDEADLEVMRRRRLEDISRLDSGVRRIVNPHIYHVSLSQALFDLKHQLIAAALGRRTSGG